MEISRDDSSHQDSKTHPSLAISFDGQIPLDQFKQAVAEADADFSFRDNQNCSSKKKLLDDENEQISIFNLLLKDKLTDQNAEIIADPDSVADPESLSDDGADSEAGAGANAGVNSEIEVGSNFSYTSSCNVVGLDDSCQ